MNNRNRVLIAGALIGAVTGLVGAMLFLRNAERSDRETTITTGEGFQLGLLVVGLLRAIAGLGDEKA